MSLKKIAAILLILSLGILISPKLYSNKYARIKDTSVDAKVDSAEIVDSGKFEALISGILNLKNLSDEYERFFVLAYSSFKRGRLFEAEKLFAKTEGHLAIIGDYILYFRSVIANDTNRPKDAIVSLEELSEKYSDSVWNDLANFQLAKALYSLGRQREAQRRIGIYKKSSHNIDTLEADALMARSIIASGNKDHALSFIRGLSVHAGSEDELKELDPVIGELKARYGVDLQRWLDKPYQQYQLARSFTEKSQWDEAAYRLESLLKMKNLDFVTEVKTKWLLARCYRWTHRYDESIELMNQLKNTRGAREYAPALTSMLATVYAKKDEYDKAISIRKEMLARLSKRSRIAANVAYKIAYLYMDEAEYSKSLQMWNKVLSMRNGRRQRALAKWNRAWCYYMLGKYDKAIKALDALQGREARRARISDRVRYWKGRIFEKKGDKLGAKLLYREVIKKHKGGYYAELAERRLNSDHRRPDDFLRVRAYYKNLGNWKLGNTGSENSSIHMKRAIVLDRMGLHREVGRELSAIDLRKHRDLAEDVMWYASKNYSYNLAMRAARIAHKPLMREDPGSGRLVRFVWERIYPEAYHPLVISYSEKDQVDRLLIWSIMRNESAFKPGVVSSAGAVGLMQLMPTTANRMSTENGNGKIDRRKLYHPAINIELGTSYLKKLGIIFPGNPVASIASYNAGEEAVLRWITNGHMNDIEEWIEEIPYSETNLYVKKVLSSYWNYKKLYRN